MEDKKHDQPLSQPDPETTHTTDPEEKMKGPVSSMMQGIKRSAEENDRPEKKEEHRREKERRENDRNAESE